MLDVVKKSLKLIDYLLLLAAVWMFSSFDYDNLSFINKVYIVSFTFWLVMLIVRIYVVYRGGRIK
ncbi:MAG: hypothetical protein IJ728_06770 [Selenomonadaceae bacterium]|nr:hypothetical protein [Selenomonadaceae bacterium]